MFPCLFIIIDDDDDDDIWVLPVRLHWRHHIKVSISIDEYIQMSAIIFTMLYIFL